jgi:hypothetical protein
LHSILSFLHQTQKSEPYKRAVTAQALHNLCFKLLESQPIAQTSIHFEKMTKNYIVQQFLAFITHKGLLPCEVSSTICIQTYFFLLPLGSALNENGDSTTKGVLCSAIREVRISHHCAT